MTALHALSLVAFALVGAFALTVVVREFARLIRS